MLVSYRPLAITAAPPRRGAQPQLAFALKHAGSVVQKVQSRSRVLDWAGSIPSNAVMHGTIAGACILTLYKERGLLEVSNRQ